MSTIVAQFPFSTETIPGLNQEDKLIKELVGGLTKAVIAVGKQTRETDPEGRLGQLINMGSFCGSQPRLILADVKEPDVRFQGFRKYIAELAADMSGIAPPVVVPNKEFFVAALGDLKEILDKVDGFKEGPNSYAHEDVSLCLTGTKESVAAFKEAVLKLARQHQMRAAEQHGWQHTEKTPCCEDPGFTPPAEIVAQRIKAVHQAKLVERNESTPALPDIIEVIVGGSGGLGDIDALFDRIFSAGMENPSKKGSKQDRPVH